MYVCMYVCMYVFGVSDTIEHLVELERSSALLPRSHAVPLDHIVAGTYPDLDSSKGESGTDGTVMGAPAPSRTGSSVI